MQYGEIRAHPDDAESFSIFLDSAGGGYNDVMVTYDSLRELYDDDGELDGINWTSGRDGTVNEPYVKLVRADE